jgi:hypothetical protein
MGCICSVHCDLRCAQQSAGENAAVGIGEWRSMLYRNGADGERAFGKRRRGLRGERMRRGGRELKVEMDDPNG